MKNVPSLLSLCILTAALPCMTSVVDAQTSPEVLADGKVTFRINAGNNRESVKATGQFGSEVVLVKGEKGVWEGTTEAAVEPGVYEYSFRVDGLNVMDGRNPAMKPQRWPGSSILHIPADPPAPWDLQDIPHGTVHHHDYHSKALGKWRKVVVYTPPNTGTERLPVLYLSHGYSDNQDTWTAHGKTHWILDSLIASGKAVPMIVVMPDAHAIEPGTQKFDDYGPKNTAAFIDEMLQDVIPLVEAAYPVKKEASARAFAGLSMGGHHALTVALQNSDTFSYIGAFSSATPADDLVTEAIKDSAGLNARLKLFWIACGDKDFLFEKNQALHAKFDEAGVKHEYVVTEGDNHSWPVWRRYLVAFAPRAFR
ncbi:MAG: esterase [Verrucomicrobiae bacterium]|nr:esterase [Verrucomicrobiae bacterium]